MDYEFGTNAKNFRRLKMCSTTGQSNPFGKVILGGITPEK